MLRHLSTAVAGLTAKTRKKYGAKALPWLWVMSDSERLPDPAAIMPALPPGTALIVRHHDAKTKSELGLRAMRVRRSAQVKILISEDWRTAAALRCDGVHMPEAKVGRLAPGLRLWRKAGRRLLTTSAHGWAGLKKARLNKVDIVFLSPVLPTRSHAGQKALGRLAFAAMAQRAQIPLAALGGVDLSSLRNLNGTRVAAIAGISFATKL